MDNSVERPSLLPTPHAESGLELKLIQSSRMATLGEMAGNIAHEINNPLTVIVGMTDMLAAKIAAGERSEAKIARPLERIAATAKRIARIVTGLRQLARDGDSDPFEPVSLKAVVDDALALCENTLRRKGITFTCASPEKDVRVRGRAVQIGQVIVNLLGNAADALEGVPVREIRVEFDVVAGMGLLRVTDSGPGIPEDVAARLFTPFFTTKAPGKGTGLGLSISRNIFENADGRLYLAARRQGTCFCLELPLWTEETPALPRSA